ncbi:hypothetical protein K490DRAFT_51294 [Saccharata proteae CBS 121410]|uniref:Folliculin-interacting protein N-terminal domain-containing protein n=1 Tax=Saccharata proteae CBS 121410 TaxID=1314787 RepID=A0A9P4HN38_9PEZI|nr:hypothetical protein K490DRAFT_51294 [Saccharata proteae CBS 121410]
MLGQLLHSFAPKPRAPTRSNPQIESVTEDSHTRDLLFPDASALYQSEGQLSSIGGSSSNGNDGTQAEIDLDQARDVRIIIAQDETGSLPKTVLYDSKPPSSESPAPNSERRGSRLFSAGPGHPSPTPGSTASQAHVRRSSLATDKLPPRAPPVSAFQRARTRGASISAMPNIDESSHGGRSPRESDELVKTCLDCMFGNVKMSYAGISNKIHIIPLEPKADRAAVASPTNSDGFNSFGRAEGRKRSHLATSYTASNIPAEGSQAANGFPDASKDPRRRTVLVTRLFGVAPPDDNDMADGATTGAPTSQGSLGKGNGFPFPSNGGPGASRGSGQSTYKQRKTPTYAIGIILHLPVASPSPGIPKSRAGPDAQRTGTKAPGSVHGHDSLGSSFDSDRRAGWAFVDSTFGVDSLLSVAASSDIDERGDVVGQHWDVISRSLTTLQFVVQAKILDMFRAADLAASAMQVPKPQKRPTSARTVDRDRPTSMPIRRNALQLHSHALLFDLTIKQAVDAAAERVVRGVKVPRVVTGQARWGVWREEARWLGKWAGGRDQNFFFFNLLTAFLGTHTEWLNSMGPKWYRRKHREQQKANAGEDLTIASRTIIVSPDKMAARRLIFLLSTFLPASAQTAPYDGMSPVRPSTSASFRAYSQSPPTNLTISRQQSLRRTINRKGNKSYPNMSSLNISTKGNSLSTLESTDDRSSPPKQEVPKSTPHSRRPSDVKSIHSMKASGLALPSMIEDPVARKNTAATASTTTPDTAVPVAHFAVQRTNSTTSGDRRPPSSSSLASDNLRHTLQRNSSHSTASPIADSQGSRWGSLVSNFWGNSQRRDSSSCTDQSDLLQTTDDGLGISGPGYRRPIDHQSGNKLEQMVQELQSDNEMVSQQDVDFYDSSDGNPAPATPDQESASPTDMPSTAARNIPLRGKHLDSPLKLSINETDGVIDVDIPLPGFGSPLQSPLLPTLGNSVSSLEGSNFGVPSMCSHMSFDSQPPINVAGWLGRFHPDFALQGVTPNDLIIEDVKRAMSAEPTPATATATPTMESGPTEKWVNICTALIADTRTFTIKRLRLKRLVRLIPAAPPSSAFTPGSVATPGFYGAGRSQYGNPHAPLSSPAQPVTELHLQERFVEENVMDIDDILVDAVERGLLHSGHPSRMHSTSSSRSSSRRGRRDERSCSDAASTQGTITGVEVPRQECKALVLGALEQVVKSVAMERGGSEDHDLAAKGKSRGFEPQVDNPAIRVKDSTLREGVRRWLSQVEEGT